MTQRVAAALLVTGCSALEVTVTRAAADAAAVDAPAEVRGDAAGPASCYRALGRLVREDGLRCGAVLIAPRVALTTAGCVLDRPGGAYLPARTLRFEAHEGAASLVERVVRGRDPDDARAAGNWAALVLVRSTEQPVASIASSNGRVRDLQAVGYDDQGARVLSVRGGCDLARLDEDSAALERCEAPARPGGVLMRCERGDAVVHALTTRRDDLRERARYEAVPLDYAREAPLSPLSLAAGPATAQGPIVYAWDGDTRRVHLRARDGDRWLPWETLDAELPASVALGATGLRVIDLPHLVFLGADRTIRHMWSDWSGVTRFAAMDLNTAPVPGAASLRDLAVTGDALRPTELYVLDAMGTVWCSRRSGGSDQAPWSRWQSLGAVPEAERLAGAAFGAGEDSTRVIAVRSPGGLHLRRSRPGYLSVAWPDGDAFVTTPDAGPARGAFAFLQTLNGEPFLLTAGTAGSLVRRSLGTELGVGTAEPFAPPLEGALAAVAASRTRDGRALLVASVRTESPGGGEIHVLRESPDGAGGFMGERWRRFYR